MYFINWLTKPYFFNSTPKTNLTLAFGVGFFIFIFLYLFEPFGMSELKGGLLLYCLGFGFVTFFTQTILFVFIPLIFKNYFKNEKWTIGKNILFLLLLITSISVSNWLYNSQVQNTEGSSLLTITEIFSYTFSVSIFPIFIFTFFSERIYSFQREKTSSNIMKFRVSNPIEKLNKKVVIFGDNKKESVNFNIDNLVYITSQGNYASFYIHADDCIEEFILRNTLTKIKANLNTYPNLIRCHKSYVVNSKFMDSISGNARGYFLESKLIDIQIPISRSFKKEELKNLIS